VSIGRTREARLKKSIREVMDLSPDWLSETLEVMEAECRQRAADIDRDRIDRDRYALQAAAIRAMIDGANGQGNLQHNQGGQGPG